jgi:hypothetical protein
MKKPRKHPAEDRRNGDKIREAERKALSGIFDSLLPQSEKKKKDDEMIKKVAKTK